eukprot:12583888-Ditylum_brightwellii.AAC.1
MQMIFDAKHDLRRKAHFIIKGHEIDSMEHTTYLSTINDILVKPMLLLAVKHNLGIILGDI